MQDTGIEWMQADPPPPDVGADGEVEAFEEAYLRYGPRLQRIAMARYSIGAADAEVLVQDVFTTYFQHASEVEALEKYLVSAICNASKNYLRRKTAARAVFSGEELSGEEASAATPGNALLDEVVRKRLLAQILARIDGRCREMLHRFYINGEGTDVIGDEMGLTRGTVKVTLFKCRQRALDAYRAIMRRS